MADFFNSEMLDSFDQSLIQRSEESLFRGMEPGTPTKKLDDDIDDVIVEEIDPSEDGLFQMLNASMRASMISSEPNGTNKKRTKKHGSPHNRRSHVIVNRQSKSSRASGIPGLPIGTEQDESVASNNSEGSSKQEQTSKDSTGSRSHNNKSHREPTSPVGEERPRLGSSTNHSKGSRSERSSTTKSKGRSKSQPKGRVTSSSSSNSRQHHQSHQHRSRGGTSSSQEQGDHQTRPRSSSQGRRRNHASSSSRRHGGEGAGGRPSSSGRSPKSPRQPPVSIPRQENEITREATIAEEETQTNSNGEESPSMSNENQGEENINQNNEEVPVSPVKVGGMGNLVGAISRGAKACASEITFAVTHPKKELEKAIGATKEAGQSVVGATKSIANGGMSAASSGVESISPAIDTADASSQEEKLPGEDVDNMSHPAPKDDLAVASSHSTPSVQSDTQQRQTGPRSPRREKDSARSERIRDESGNRKHEAQPSRSSGSRNRNRNQLSVSEHTGRSRNSGGARMTIRERRNIQARTRGGSGLDNEPKESSKTASGRIDNLSGHSAGKFPISGGAAVETDMDLDGKNQAVENSAQPSTKNKEWLQARSSRQDDIMSFIKQKDGSDKAGSPAPRTIQEWPSDRRASLPRRDSEGSQDEEQKRKNILTAGGKVAKIAIGVTAFGAREAINAIKNPKKEMQKVVRLSNKAASKAARAASDPKLAVQRVASATQKVSANIVREATEVTKGTVQLGKQTVTGTVGWLMQDDGESSDGERKEYNSQTMASRKVNDSLMDRVANVVDTPNEKSSQSKVPSRRQKRAERGPRQVMVDGMPERMPSRLVTSSNGKATTSWET
jgi:hypothetical protein